MQKPNRVKERIAGIAGALCAPLWVFAAALKIIDWIGRLQTTMALTPYMSVLVTPLALITELVVAVGLLFYATRLEHAHEKENTPRIIQPWSRPERPKRHWFWLKVALWFCAVSLGIVLCIFLLLKYNIIGPTKPTPAVINSTREQSIRPGAAKRKVVHSETAAPQRPSTQTELLKRGVSDVVTARDDTQVAKSIPTTLIPQDPVKAVEAVEGMRSSLREILVKKASITFLISWNDDDSTYLVLVSGLLSSACGDTPRQCWFTQPGNAHDLDKPPIKGSGRRGITIHGPDAAALARALGRWFETYSTSAIPPSLSAYKEPGTEYLIWIEIGPGAPWKQ